MEPDSSTTLVIVGASGRAGSTVVRLALDDPRFRLVAAVVADGSDRAGQLVEPGRAPGDGAGAPRGHALKYSENTAFSARVVIDFSTDAGTRKAVDIALRAGAALLVATTALTGETARLLDSAAGSIPVLVAPNTSIGVAVLNAALKIIASSLPAAFEPSIVEFHHRAKRDAPSGTAKRLAETVRNAGMRLEDANIAAVRAGPTIGEHEVRFDGPAESVSLIHKATSREAFARGALDAACWLRDQPPGMYRIEHALGLPL